MEYRLLGPLEVVREGEVVPVGAAKHRALLAMLLLARNRVVSSDALIDQLWNGDPPASAPNILQVYVSQLRKVLDPDRPRGASSTILVTRAPGYSLVTAAAEVDADRFLRLANEGRSLVAAGRHLAAARVLEEGLALWRGEPLSEFGDAPFARDEAGRLEESRLAALDDLTDAELELGRHAELVPRLQALVAEHPFREREREQLMLALYRAGRQREALDVYRETRLQFVDELGIEPGAKLQELHAAILRQDASLDGRGSEPSKRSALPTPGTSLVGRDQELQEVESLVMGPSRIVTITGPGGVGKTRLSLEVARAVEQEFEDGVRLVDLSGLSDPDLVMPTVVASIGEQTESALVVLDNFEQILRAGPALSEFLRGRPGLTVLVTSRARLHLDGEYEFALEPLDASSAVTLFLERARAAGRTLDDVGVVEQICQALDGLPLALELAAARSKILDPETLLEQLDRPLSLLAAGRRDAPDRHRALRATIDWSYDLLGAEGKRLFARLSVCAGGCTLEAAEAIGGADLDAVASLVDKSLVRADGRRIKMLETIREYARERLDRSDEANAVREHHAHYYLEVVREADEHLTDPDQADWFRRLAEEQDNLRTALTWASESGDEELALALVAAAGWFWFMRGQFDEARRWLEAALATDAGPPLTRATALMRAGAVEDGCGDYVAAEAHYKEALDLRRESGDLAGAVSVLNNLGALANSQADYGAADAWYERALALASEADDQLGVATALCNMGIAAAASGDASRAVGVLSEAIPLMTGLGNPYALAVARQSLGSALLQLGEREEAARQLDEALALHSELDEPLGVASALEELAAVAAVSGDAERAARHLGAASAIRVDIGAAVHPADLDRRTKTERTARAQIGDADFELAYRAGLDADRAAAIAYASTGPVG